MARAAVIGEALSVEGFGLAGAIVYPADSEADALSAWDSLPADAALLIVTTSAARWLSARLAQRPDLLTAVLAP
jgi:vacuolar-type H+-ATPase subunit F/Vma7